uniref:SET domain-containing protein n=1 Tax=Syphacia muris TaxID=451379 RepID=A0A0N5AGX6_9BILA
MDSEIPDTIGNVDSGKCLVVDAIERTVKIVKKEHGNPDYLDLQPLTADQLSNFGIRIAEADLVDDDYIHCELCDAYYHSSCFLHPLFLVSDREVREETRPRDEQTLPAFFEIRASKIPKAGLGVFSKVDVPIGLFLTEKCLLLTDANEADQQGYSWELRIDGKPSKFVDGSNRYYSNWMRFINSSRFESEQNLIAFQYNGSVYYRVFRPINEGDELLVWYGKKYGESLGVLSVSQKAKKQSLPISKNPFVF